MKTSAIKVALDALNRAHKLYGEEIKLLKFVPSATGSIYRQSKKIYETPYLIRGSVARFPVESEIGATGEASERNAEVTIPVQYMVDLFGDSTPLKEMITVSDLLIFDNRVWRIVQASLTGRIGAEPTLMYIVLREKLGAKEKDYE